MKNRVFMGLAAGLALALISGAALAEVKTTGTVWMRSGPSLNDTQVTSVREGKTLEYLGESREDERGVAWYKVSDGKNTGWISSKYAELTGEDAAAAPAATEEPEDEDNDEADAPAARPALDVGLLFATGDSGKEEAGDKAPEALPGKAVELSGYYLNNLVDTANELGVISYRQVESEVPYQYYNEAVILAGNQGLEGIVVYGPGYEVYGAAVGMDVNAARAALNAAGLDFVSDGNGHVTFEHKAGEDAAYADENGHDSCITLWVDEDGTVTEIDWSTYTG